MATSRRAKPKKLEPKWKTVEKVAAMVEHLIDPKASVRHNVTLPDLVTGLARQCDVVVETGPEHRRTRSIVEVQKRGKAVEIGTFEGWVAKMHAVGAQHLICVSAKGFPESVTRKAAQLGPMVRLCLLKELNQRGALEGIDGLTFLRTHFIDTIQDIELGMAIPPDGAERELNLDAQLFTTATGLVLSFNEIARHLVNRHAEHLGMTSGIHKIKLAMGDAVTFQDQDEARLVKPRCVVTVRVEVEQLRHEVFEYQQMPHPDPLHWVLVALATGSSPQVTIAFAPGADGRLRPGKVQVSGLRPDSLFSLSLGSRSRAVLVR